MRTGPDKDRRFELRRRIDKAEAEIEVSEFAKVCSHLAYLMRCFVRYCPRVREEFRQEFGVMWDMGGMSDSQRAWLRAASLEMGLGRELELVPSFMWRAWLDQEDLRGASPVRDWSEWPELPKRTNDRRRRLLKMLDRLYESLVDLGPELPKTASEAKHLLSNVSGSPLAVVRAAADLLHEHEAILRRFERHVQRAYGFGRHHRPNRRFDKMAKRNIETYFYWRHMSDRPRFSRPFRTRMDGKPRDSSKARAEAVKAASRFEAELHGYEAKLQAWCEAGLIPLYYYAQRTDSQRRREGL